MQTLKHYNINIPGEVALAGYSNDFACSVTAPGLTSIEQHTKKMGNMAANLFLEQASKFKSIGICFEKDRTKSQAGRKRIFRKKRKQRDG